MSSINKVIIIGNLGHDPELRHMSNGEVVVNISIATTETWKSKNSEDRKEFTEWHRVVCYRRMAEIVSQFLRKGSQIYIEGRLHTRKWTDKNGIVRYLTEIIANNMQMLGNKNISFENSLETKKSKDFSISKINKNIIDKTFEENSEINNFLNLEEDDEIPF